MNKEHHDQFDQDLKCFQKEWFIRDPGELTKTLICLIWRIFMQYLTSDKVIEEIMKLMQLRVCLMIKLIDSRLRKNEWVYVTKYQQLNSIVKVRILN